MHSILVLVFFFVLNYIHHTICTYYDYTYTINIYILLKMRKLIAVAFKRKQNTKLN